MPTKSDFTAMFQKSKFHTFSCMNLLPHSKYADNYEGPLDKTWRESISYWAVASEAEIQEVERVMRDLKDSGKLVEWASSRDKIDTCGMLSVFACSAV